tara:strand:+ start:10964 stop:12931 length:1968 start_codon:yes stop_codon:yes gene_type:complete
MLETSVYAQAADDLAHEILLAASEPPVRLDLLKWVQENVRVPDGPRAGLLWDLDMTPFWREILEMLSPENPVTRISVRKSAQVGFTMILIAWGLAITARIRRSALFVFPTLPFARDFNNEKFEPAIERCEASNQAVLPIKSRSGGGSTALNKRFSGGSVRLTGANSTADFRGKTVPLIGADEIDEIPRDLNGQGDGMRMIDARQDAHRKTGDFKKLEGGTPTVKGSCRIDDCFEAGDQRLYMVPCPQCGKEQAFEFERLHYKPNWPHEAYYACAENGCVIHYDKQTSMLKAGRWVATAPAPGKHPSYAINALYSPFISWDDIVIDYLSCKDDPLQLMSFTNLKLGKSYELKGTAPGWKELQDRAQRLKICRRGEIPNWALFLTAGVDVQERRLEIVIYGWGIGKSRIPIDWIVIEGDTSDLTVWGRLTEVWQAEYRTLGGMVRFIEMMAVDSGYRSDMVYNWVRGKENNIRGRPRAMAVKGANRPTNWILGGASKTSFQRPGVSTRGNVMLWAVGVHIAKASFYGYLGLEGPNEAGQFPPGFVHFPEDFPDTFYQQATSELLKPIAKRGGRVEYEWTLPSGRRNEVLDCSNYAHAAAIQLGMDKMTPEQWAALAEERTACAPDKGQMDLLSAVVAPPAKSDGAPKTVKSLAGRLA